MYIFVRRLFFLMVLMMVLHAPMSALCAVGEGGDSGFEIRVVEITGNTIFDAGQLKGVVEPFIGAGKTATDVEKARDAIEKYYHDAGYPAVIVNIPEQTLKDGVVKLEVIESKIGRVKITGNRYFTMEKIMDELPSLGPGRDLYLPDVQTEIGRLNRGEDLKIEPGISPAKEVGTIDVELKVEDHLPLHGYLEINNKASHDTKPLRLNAMVRYDNLWQKNHSLSLQYQTAPQDPKQVEVIGVSYVLPSPWDKDQQLALYGIWSGSTTNTKASGEGFQIIGKGDIFGVRDVIPLAPYKLYTHNITVGLDYKHFHQAVGFTTNSGETTHTPISYTPLSFSYSASLPDEFGGTTQFSTGLNMSFRGVGSKESEFENKRFKGMANYLYATAGIQRTQKMPWGMNLFMKVDGQLADQPLIDNEQYIAGGMESVRGYRESEASGDNAIHGTLEVSFPAPIEKTAIGKWLQLSPFLFYDMARLVTKDPLSGQDRNITLQGAGAGIRGTMTKYLEYELDWAMALAATDKIQKYDQSIYFKLKAIL